jgi:hypothetical protein
MITELLDFCPRHLFWLLTKGQIALGGLVVSVLANGPQIRWFKSGRGRWIFKGDKKSVALLPSKGK